MFHGLLLAYGTGPQLPPLPPPPLLPPLVAGGIPIDTVSIVCGTRPDEFQVTLAAVVCRKPP